MTRRQLLAAPGLAATQGRTKPNVLFIPVDDLQPRIRCFGDSVAITPNLDRLAARGVRFHRAYCQYPLCNPTRSSLLSGRYPTSTGVLDNNTYLPLGEGHLTLPEMFERNGYAVSLHGKIWHGPNRGLRPGEAKPAKPEGWFTSAERTRQKSEDPEYWSRTHSPYRNLALTEPARYAWANEFGPLPDGDAGPDAPTADKALASIKDAVAKGKPFFVGAGFVKPHVPLKVPKKYFDKFNTDAMPLPPDFDTEPRAIEGYPRDEFRQNIDLFAARPFTAAEARAALRAYYASVTYMDDQLGRLLDHLDSTGLARNTIVVLFGDHGWHLSNKGMWAKGTLFEASARGPLIVVDPRRAKGQTCERVVQYLDMYPTLADLCGLPPGSWLEGTSLRPLLDNPRAAWDKPAFTFQTRGWYLGRSVRTERWRYTEWDEGRRGAALFDHDRDPHEMRNLAGDPAQGEVVRRMKGLLARLPG